VSCDVSTHSLFGFERPMPLIQITVTWVCIVLEYQSSVAFPYNYKQNIISHRFLASKMFTNP
jgi:hypothetical protein